MQDNTEYEEMSDSLFSIVFIGLCTGFGSALGNYFALKYAIQHIDKIPSVKETVREMLRKEKE